MNDMTNEGDIEETEKINIVPLADLTLVLLIILMVLSPMISQSMIRVATPQVQSSGEGAAAENQSTEEKVPLLIAVNENGFELNNVRFDELDSLFANLKAKLDEDQGRPVIVSAADGVYVGRVVEVLDVARQVGAKEVSLVKSISKEGAK